MGHQAVQLPFSLSLALRYLQPKRTFVSAITLISVLSVTFAIAMPILVISVMTGFDHELRRKVLGFDAHLLITSDGVLRDWRKLDARIRELPNVVATAPFVQGPVIVDFQGRRLAPKIRGIDPEREKAVTNVMGAVKEGRLDLAMDEEGKSNKAVLGRALANELGVTIGDHITVYSPGNLSTLISELEKAKQKNADAKTLDELQQMILPADLEVTGIFESGRYIYDAEFLLVPLHIAQELYGLEDALHGITVKTVEPYRATEVKREVLQIAPPEVEALTWIDLNKDMFEAIRVERNVMFIILMAVVVVAAFGIASTLITVVVQKTRDIGIMKAVGASPGQIVWVFVFMGMIVGVIGNVMGVILALLTVGYRNALKEWLAHTFHIELFPPNIYQFSELPAEIVPHDVALTCVSAFLICTFAAVVPALFAARLDPVKALRHD